MKLRRKRPLMNFNWLPQNPVFTKRCDVCTLTWPFDKFHWKTFAHFKIVEPTVCIGCSKKVYRNEEEKAHSLYIGEVTKLLLKGLMFPSEIERYERSRKEQIEDNFVALSREYFDWHGISHPTPEQEDAVMDYMLRESVQREILKAK